MRIGPYNNRTPRNVIRGSSRGDQFNTAHKKERHDEPPQFHSREVEEKKRFSETRDARSDCSDAGSRGNKKGKDGNKAAQNLTNAIVRQAVVMVAGAVIVTNSYQAAVEKRELERLNTAAAAAEEIWLDEEALEDVDSEALAEAMWIWAEDNSTASFFIPGVGNAEAVVTVTEEPAGCTTEGLRTYTASVVVNGTTYTDVITEVIPAAGHSFGEAQTETDADGNITILYHCSGCDQVFEVGFTTEKAEE